MTVTATILFQITDNADGHHGNRGNDDDDSDGTHSDSSKQ